MTESVAINMGEHGPSLYQRVGGMDFFTGLTAAFYRRVVIHPALLALYPEPDDLGPAAERLALFLAQYWGGPTTYSDKRGHPRLRMRHAPFRIDAGARDTWLECFLAALNEVEVADPERTEIAEHATRAAYFLVNAPG